MTGEVHYECALSDAVALAEELLGRPCLPWKLPDGTAWPALEGVCVRCLVSGRPGGRVRVQAVYEVKP